MHLYTEANTWRCLYIVKTRRQTRLHEKANGFALYVPCIWSVLSVCTYSIQSMYVHVHVCICSGTALKRTPLGLKKMSSLEMCPLFGGRVYVLELGRYTYVHTCVSSLERHPQFWDVVYEGFHCIHTYININQVLYIYSCNIVRMCRHGQQHVPYVCPLVCFQQLNFLLASLIRYSRWVGMVRIYNVLLL